MQVVDTVFSISHPELVYFYRPVGKSAPRQVVEPSAGVRSQTTHRPAPDSYHKGEEEGMDFSVVFNKALSRGPS